MPELDPTLDAMLTVYVARYPALRDQATCENSCSMVATELIGELNAIGRHGAEVWFRGHRDPTTRTLPVPPGLDGSEHVAVQVDGGLVIDLARRQFDREADLPTVYATIAAAARDWRWFNMDPRRRSPWQSLG